MEKMLPNTIPAPAVEALIDAAPLTDSVGNTRQCAPDRASHRIASTNNRLHAPCAQPYHPGPEIPRRGRQIRQAPLLQAPQPNRDHVRSPQRLEALRNEPSHMARRVDGRTLSGFIRLETAEFDVESHAQKPLGVRAGPLHRDSCAAIHALAGNPVHEVLV